MTIPYNSTLYGSLLKFIAALREDGIEYRNFSKEEQRKIQNTHKEFFNNVKYGVKKEFFEREESKDLIIFKYNKWVVSSIKEHKINYKNKRDKYQSVEYEIREDPEKTERALEANNMHFLDAKLMEYLITKMDIIPIHDCFGVRLNELHMLIDATNEYYKQYIPNKSYAPYILI